MTDRGYRSLKEDQKETEHLIYWGGLVLSIAMVLWAIFFVPMNNDEVVPYHLLACWAHPFSQLDTSVFSGCDHRYDLTTPFGFKIARATSSLGVLPSLIYAPFYFVLSNAYSHYAMGIIFFIGFSYLLAKMTANPRLSIIVFLSSFPLALNFIHDVGPIKFGLMLYPICCWLFIRMLNSSRSHGILYAILFSFLIILAIEEQSFYLFLLPGYTFFLLAFVKDRHGGIFKHLVRSWGLLTLALFLSCSAIILLLFSILPDGTLYGASLLNFVKNFHLATDQLDNGPSEGVLNLFRFLIFWPSYANRFFNLNITFESYDNPIAYGKFLLQSSLPGLLLIASLIAAYFNIRNKKNMRLSSRVVLLVFSSLVTFVVYCLLGSEYDGFYFVFIWVPWLMLFAELLNRLSWRTQLGLMTLYLLVNFTPILWLSQLDTLNETSLERDAVSSFFSKERDYKVLINYISGGQHNIQSLYGSTNQLVTTMIRPDEVKRLFELSKTTHRSLYIVCHAPELRINQITGDLCTQKIIEKSLSAEVDHDINLHEVMPGLNIWHVYEVIH